MIGNWNTVTRRIIVLFEYTVILRTRTTWSLMTPRFNPRALLVLGDPMSRVGVLVEGTTGVCPHYFSLSWASAITVDPRGSEPYSALPRLFLKGFVPYDSVGRRNYYSAQARPEKSAVSSHRSISFGRSCSTTMNGGRSGQVQLGGGQTAYHLN